MRNQSRITFVSGFRTARGSAQLRLRVLLGLAVIAMLLLVPLGGQARAQAPQAAKFTVGQLLRINFTVSFAWLRKDPTSAAPVVDTAQRGEFVIVANSTPSFDGTQWWWLVARAAGAINGWVEQNSIEAAIISATNTAAPVKTVVPGTVQPWTADTVLVPATGVPFIWVRTEPRPDAPIRLSIFPGTRVSPQPNVATVLDQYNQVWWLVRIPALNRIGWIEQASLMVAPPTATPSATSTAAATLAQAPESWAPLQPVVVRAGVPFLYVRTAGNSFAPIVVTARPGELMVVVSGPVSDSVQYWWQVQHLPSGRRGWVEQAYLQVGPPPTLAVTATATAIPAATATPSAPAAPWRPPNVLTIKPGIAYIWLRAQPTSFSLPPLAVERTSPLIVSGGPSWDGTQWWWRVQSSSTGVIGWVEQNSLAQPAAGDAVAAPSATVVPTEAPTATPAS